MRKLTDSQEKHAIQIGLEGNSPCSYLEIGCGISNGAQCWAGIKKRLKKSDPETYDLVIEAMQRTKDRERMAKRRTKEAPESAEVPEDVKLPEPRKWSDIREAREAAEKEVPAPVFSGGPTAADAMEAMGLAADEFFEKAGLPGVVHEFAEDGVHLKKTRKPAKLRQFDVTGVHGLFGRYDHYTLNGTEYFDYEGDNGEEMSMPVTAWKDFLGEIAMAAELLGVEL